MKPLNTKFDFPPALDRIVSYIKIEQLLALDIHEIFLIHTRFSQQHQQSHLDRSIENISLLQFCSAELLDAMREMRLN